MACGNAQQVVEKYLGICWASFRYPCGIKWCKKWGIPYPCGLKWCTGHFPYPCIKRRTVTKYCFDFAVVHENCKVFVSKFYGCCEGREYEWSGGCLGWFDAYYTQKRICLDTPPKEIGPCTAGNSIPPSGQIPGVFIDEGSVGVRPTDGFP